MKRILSILLTSCMVLSLCACNKTDNPSGNNSSNNPSVTTPEDVVISTEELMSYYDFNIDDYVKLGDYKNIEVNLPDTYEITDEAVIEYINMYLTYNSDVKESDRTVVQNGDVVTIDYSGKMDGVVFDGGTETNQQITIGAGGMIPGFEEGIVGHSKGETFDVNATFPTPYPNKPDFEGKTAVFTITVHDIYEPVTHTYETLTDEYVKSAFGVDTVDEYVKKTKEQMQANADSQKQTDAEQEYLKQLLAICEVTIPEDYMNTYCDQIMNQVETYAKDVLKMEVIDYIKQYENFDSIEEFKAGLREQLETETKQQFILDAIIKKDGRTITQTGYDDFVDYYMSLYSITDEEEFYKQYGTKESIMLVYAENSLLADLMEETKINVGVIVKDQEPEVSETPSVEASSVS